jgi:hypothetical protein
LRYIHTIVWAIGKRRETTATISDAMECKVSTGSRLLMGQKKRNKVSSKRVGSTLADSRMNAEASRRFYQRQKLPLAEALALASPVISRSTSIRALAKPTEEVRVVTAEAPKPKVNSPVPSNRSKSSDGGSSIRTIRQDAPGLGLPWVPGPPTPKKRKRTVQPQKAKTPTKKESQPPAVANRKILFHEGQPRVEAGIRFVQGGLPYLGKR